MFGGKKRKEARRQAEWDAKEALKTGLERSDPNVLLIVATENLVVSLYQHKVKIRSLAKSSLLTTGLVGEKEIWLNQVTAVQLREPSKLGLGYIQFVYAGSQEKKGGTWDAISDENSVVFGAHKLTEFIKLKNEIERLMIESRSRQHGSQSQRENVAHSAKPSVADELLKYSQLRDQGAISAKEFDQIKKRLLKT